MAGFAFTLILVANCFALAGIDPHPTSQVRVWAGKRQPKRALGVLPGGDRPREHRVGIVNQQQVPASRAADRPGAEPRPARAAR